MVVSITNWKKNYESGRPSPTCYRCCCLHHRHHLPPACPHRRCRYPADGARIRFPLPIRFLRCRPVAGGGCALEKGTRGERAMGLARAEQEERLRWEKQRGRRRRSNLGFAGWSPCLMKWREERENGWARAFGVGSGGARSALTFHFYTMRFTFRCEP
jgi:hypothetical protein